MKWHHIEKGQGRPLILLHGIGMNSEAWTPVFDRLALQRRVIALDIPGFGRTPSLSGGVAPDAASLTDALSQSLRQMGLDEPVDMVGNSLGGRIVLEAAAAGLARSVVAISPAGFWKEKGPRHLESLFGAMRQGYKKLPGVADKALGTGVGRTLLMGAAVSPRVWKMPTHEARKAARLFAESSQFDPVFDAFRPPFERGADVQVPCTIAFGDLDLVFPLGTRDRSRAPAHAHWLRLSACGHVPMWDNPGKVAHLILNGTR